MDRSSASKTLRIVSQCIVSALLVLACGQGKSESPGEPISTDSQALVCNEWTSIEDRELYVLPAINRLLGYFPEFAAYAGIDWVSDCDGGRQFAAAYDAYSALHPGFDLVLPLGEVAGPEPVPEGPPPDLRTSKILGGVTPSSVFNWAYPAAAIVELHNAEQGRCTGTFIAKNWILTAAHCLSTIASPGTTLTGLRGYSDWLVEWPNGGGDIALQVDLLAKHTLQIPHPDFTSSARTHDVALLFLHPILFDEFLPGRPDQGAAMRISGLPPSQLNHRTGDPTITTSFAGYSAVENLFISKPEDSVVNPSGETAGDFIITLNSATQDGTCKGDSGGPLFARVPPQMFPPEAGVVAGTPAALELGVFSGFRPPTPDRECARLGDQQLWTRIDVLPSVLNTLGAKNADFLFIQQTFRKWYFTPFACRGGRYVGHVGLGSFDSTVGIDDYYECWGKPCQQQSDCGTSAYCSFPKSSLVGKNCPFCPTHGCDCVVGQCLPIPSSVPVCTDALRNGDETDVDCGGSCPGCALGKRCLVDADCFGQNCVTGLCR
jgi:hypothetical protein